MEKSEIIQDFLNYLKFERHLSEHTVESYGVDLVYFSRFLFLIERPKNSKPEVDVLLLSADTKIIEAYLAFLKEIQYSKATIARKIHTLQGFYKFLIKRNKLSLNPVTGVKGPKPEKKPPRFLEYKEIKKLLETPPMDNWLGARDRAILETLYSTGMRASELVALNIDDIDFLGEVVHIRSKGKKERIVSISSSALQVISRYLEFKDKRAQKDSKFDTKVLFVNKHGQRLSDRSVRRKMEKYVKMAGLGLSISPKTLRHSFAMHMLMNGVDLRSVQELLGHQMLASTKVYTHLNKS